MSLYARSDLMSVSIPATSGGCGDSHSRPVSQGSPAKTWRLDCPPCESYLKGARKPPVLKTTPGDPKLGIPAKQERVADADPHWSSTPESVPLTPDELSVNATRTARARDQIELIKARAALSAAGIEVPFETMWLMERELPSAFLQGKILCPNGHENVAGGSFCSKCAVSMNLQKEIGTAPAVILDEPAGNIPLEDLHVATLKKMCRGKGFSDKGTKQQLIGRLS